MLSDCADETTGASAEGIRHEPRATLQHHATDSIAEAAAVVADQVLEAEESQDSMVEVQDEETVLKNLTAGVRDQADLEKDITVQASAALNEQEDERDKKRIEKATASREKLLRQKTTAQRRLAAGVSVLQREVLRTEVARLNRELEVVKNDIHDLQMRMRARQATDTDRETFEVPADQRQSTETHREFLIRTGKITPFSRIPTQDAAAGGDLGEVLMDAEDEVELDDQVEKSAQPQSRQNLRLPGFLDKRPDLVEDEFHLRPRKKRQMNDGSALSSAVASEDESVSRKSKSSKATPDVRSTPDTDASLNYDYHDYDDDDDDDDDDLTMESHPHKSKKSKKSREAVVDDLTELDDGNEENYQARLASWVKRRSRAREDRGTVDAVPDGRRVDEEWFREHPDEPDHQIRPGLKLPGDIFPALFDYQKTGVQWLGELHEQQVGGIIGDEMGLGKTIQIISFLAALHYSKKLTKPIIVVAPATVLRQWVNEFHRWWPPLRVSILHSSGSGMSTSVNEEVDDDFERYEQRFKKKQPKGLKAAKQVLSRVMRNGHVLVTTYHGLKAYSEILMSVKWGYAVLDEGHKIRNPNAAVTVCAKELQTVNRVILSGTPMQNNLIELWSLFDFVYPMRLGTLVNFRNQFEVPIKLGGYANATNLQILTASKCAETLKDAISPYLLQRFKVDVAADLPKKSEQVLFCKLTKGQREAYELFLRSDEMTSILNKTRQSLYGIDILRKICNHPDLLDKNLKTKPGYRWGNPHKSGKMQVTKALMQLWKRAGDKILLFSQGKLMLDIFEAVLPKDGFRYLRMDGGTPVKDRQNMVDRFNNDPDIDLFLLTTKVGGLGVNLTGANRVIIFDPDWNPSTDMQARERAWRLGQKKEVTIYRLLLAGTIEEKVYHRQLFKQFLSDKVLKDPKQSQTFHIKDLHDLFTLGSAEDSITETGELFRDTETHRFDNGHSSERPGFRESFMQERPFTGAENQIELIKRPMADTPSADTRSALKFQAEDNVVRTLAGVVSLEAYKDDDKDTEASLDDSKPDRVLEGIFARSGVHSVLEHDQIINGKKRVQPDRGMNEREARRVAGIAAAELRRAAEIAQNTPIGTVTWTGEVGEGGRQAPTNLRRGGPAAASVLGNLAARQGNTAVHRRPSYPNPMPARTATAGGASGTSNANGARGGTDVPTVATPALMTAKDFMRMIPTFIAQHGGSVPSQALIVHFSHMCPAREQSATFQAVLKEVAVLKKGTGTRGRGRWELKPEFVRKVGGGGDATGGAKKADGGGAKKASAGGGVGAGAKLGSGDQEIA